MGQGNMISKSHADVLFSPFDPIISDYRVWNSLAKENYRVKPRFKFVADIPWNEKKSNSLET